MNYAEIMIQAYAEANGITRAEAIHSLKISDLVPADEPQVSELANDPQLEELLNDLCRDPEGVLAWAG